MFVPGNNLKFLNNAFQSNADILILDLEDSVQNKKNKALAREIIISSLKLNKNKKVFIRINDVESGEILDDIDNLMIEGVEGFMYPKSQSGLDIFFIDKLLESFEYKKGIKIGKFKLIPIIETSSAIINVDAICKSSKRVIAIAYGSEDYLTDMGATNDPEGSTIFLPRVLITIAAKANNIVPIDTVQINVHDLDNLERNLKISKKLGFEGMLVLHPKQLPLVHQFFTPTLNEIKNAKLVLKISENINKDGKGVDIVDGKFVGPPMIKAANKIMQKQKIFKVK
jgi:citrate lyase subunit beta/citryl-CoA lyase